MVKGWQTTEALIYYFNHQQEIMNRKSPFTLYTESSPIFLGNVYMDISLKWGILILDGVISHCSVKSPGILCC